MTFEDLYNRLLKAAVNSKMPEELNLIENEGYDPHQLDCLINPHKHEVVLRTGQCNCSPEEKDDCKGKCLFDALFINPDGNIDINGENCVGCGDCIKNCKKANIIESKDSLAMLESLYRSNSPVYAMIAPAFVNQYSDEITPGKLRAAFKRIGFTGMVEVALFADILTMKEALEFDRNIKTEEDFQLTSCCCPMWIAMIRKVYSQLVSHVPAAVSPMVACGRSIKELYPGAITVFIGPCMAKKAEAKEKDVSDSTDFVLTFKEIQDIFDFAGLNLKDMEEDERDHSSKAGRIYAGTGGVSEAVREAVERINPTREITVKTRHANGVAECKKMLNDILVGAGNANFYEGMGCVGGCVGGPKALIPKEEGKESVLRYGEEAIYKTPFDNPYVVKMLHDLGLETVDSLLEERDIFIRKW